MRARMSVTGLSSYVHAYVLLREGTSYTTAAQFTGLSGETDGDVDLLPRCLLRASFQPAFKCQ